MKTYHRIFFDDARYMSALPDGSIDLVVTSPPYPMIAMWDDLFTRQNADIAHALKVSDGSAAFELMHRELDKVWDELSRVLKAGGVVCINIGDATRTIADRFALFTNHARIHTYLQKIGFSALPAILWCKPTNAPNKFMGSGMMPPGAYVTLEHEYVLILRKGDKRPFTSPADKQHRRESAFFWEERNVWFSDVWTDLIGTTQALYDSASRNRSGAFPFELPYRLISMFSVKGDTVLDPFMGLGTTMLAAMAAGRNSYGYELDDSLAAQAAAATNRIVVDANRRIRQRLENHLAFVAERCRRKGPLRYENHPYRFPVVTRQETDLVINDLLSIERTDASAFTVTYAAAPQAEFVARIQGAALDEIGTLQEKTPTPSKTAAKAPRQRKLFG